MGHIAKWFLGINPIETKFATRGFSPCGPNERDRLESIGSMFVHGYHAVLENDDPQRFVPRLKEIAPEYRGFAYEGAAMGLGLLDRITPWRRTRAQEFIAGEGDPFTYLVHVGLGWAMARWPGPIDPFLSRLDPVLGWLTLDGYGFHEGYFHWNKYQQNQPIPKRVRGYAGRVFDQGLGRSLWFIEGGDVHRLKSTVDQFSEERRADLWSGIGLACVYAGELQEKDLGALVVVSGRFHPHLAQGAAFAAKARIRGANPTPYTDRACRSLCGLSANAAAELTDEAWASTPNTSTEPFFERWRTAIRLHFR